MHRPGIEAIFELVVQIGLVGGAARDELSRARVAGGGCGRIAEAEQRRDR